MTDRAAADPAPESKSCIGGGEQLPASNPPSAKAASLPDPLRRKVARFAKEIRDDHGLLDRNTADRLARLLKTSVVPRRKPGRKTSPEVLMAVELRKQSMPWPKVYGRVIPGYWKLSYLDRFWRSTRLRDAVRAHRRRRGLTKQSGRTPSAKRTPKGHA